ncbi:hypothetical protein AAHC03_0458 [Spirometra sp. Aus1]
MDSTVSKLNPDAEEFKPSGLSDRELAMGFVRNMLANTFDSSGQAYDENIKKVLSACAAYSTSDAPCLVGACVAQMSMIKSGNATLGFRVIRQLQKNLPSELFESFECGVLAEIHNLTLSQISGGYLRKLAETKSASSVESGDAPAIDGTPVLLIELLHLVMLCITDLYKTDSDQISVPPPLPVLDLCLLADSVFKVQAECVENLQASPDSSADALSKKIPKINGWHCILDAFLGRIMQSLPCFSVLIQSSGECIPPSTWASTQAFSDKILRETDADDKTYPYSASFLARLVNRVLFRVKKMLVDNNLPSPWLRSTALDLLLAAVPAVLSVPYTNNVNELPECSSASDGDDVSIEGLSSAEDSEVINAFKSFLKSSGQVEDPMQADT